MRGYIEALLTNKGPIIIKSIIYVKNTVNYRCRAVYKFRAGDARGSKPTNQASEIMQKVIINLSLNGKLL